MIFEWQELEAIFEISQEVQTEINSVLYLWMSQEGFLVKTIQSIKLLSRKERFIAVYYLDLICVGVLLLVFSAGFSED